ncbi:hypothetical protein CPB86DRAFT_767017, partial [Serendipita vermifera]
MLLKICGTIRDVVLATPNFWTKKIRIRVGARSFFDRPSRDISLEQLDFTLKHADPFPLDLWIDLVQGDRLPSTLDLISSRQCLIRSLKISDSGRVNDSLWEPLIKKLNICSLKNFYLLGSSPDRARKVMDLVMQASQGRMTIDVQVNTYDLTSILQHYLLQRADKLFISNDLTASSTSTKISFPQLRTLRFEGDYRQINVVNFINLSELHICSSVGGLPIAVVENLPVQLTTLSVRNFIFAPEQPSEPNPRPLPNFVTLNLTNVLIKGPLQTYLELPRLRHIDLCRVTSIKVDSVDALHWYGKEESIFTSDLFLSSTPLNVESVTISQMTVDERLILGLRSNPNLQSLAIRKTNIDSTLLSSFIQYLNPDTGFFPTLNRIEWETRWPQDLGTSYEKFAEYCISRRPKIEFYGKVIPELRSKLTT